MHSTVCNCHPRVSACIFTCCHIKALTPLCPLEGSEEFHMTRWSLRWDTFTSHAHWESTMGHITWEYGLYIQYGTLEATKHRDRKVRFRVWIQSAHRDLICASKVFLGVTAVKADGLNVGLGPIFSREGCSCRIQFMVPTEMLHTVSDLTLDWRVDINLRAVEM